jgi:hypothetical protein
MRIEHLNLAQAPGSLRPALDYMKCQSRIAYVHLGTLAPQGTLDQTPSRYRSMEAGRSNHHCRQQLRQYTIAPIQDPYELSGCAVERLYDYPNLGCEDLQIGRP